MPPKRGLPALLSPSVEPLRGYFDLFSQENSNDHMATVWFRRAILEVVSPSHTISHAMLNFPLFKLCGVGFVVVHFTNRHPRPKKMSRHSTL